MQIQQGGKLPGSIKEEIKDKLGSAKTNCNLQRKYGTHEKNWNPSLTALNPVYTGAPQKKVLSFMPGLPGASSEKSAEDMVVARHGGEPARGPRRVGVRAAAPLGQCGPRAT